MQIDQMIALDREKILLYFEVMLRYLSVARDEMLSNEAVQEMK